MSNFKHFSYDYGYFIGRIADELERCELTWVGTSVQQTFEQQRKALIPDLWDDVILDALKALEESSLFETGMLLVSFEKGNKLKIVPSFGARTWVPQVPFNKARLIVSPLEEHVTLIVEGKHWMDIFEAKKSSAGLKEAFSDLHREVLIKYDLPDV